MSGKQCPYCDRIFDESIFETDHIVPQACDGSNDEENLIDVCRECNRIKGDWNVDRVIGENASKEEKIEEIRRFLEWEKGAIRRDSDHPYQKGYC